MVDSILQGTPAKNLPIQDPQKLLFYINRLAAQKMGVHITDSIHKQADMIL